MMKNRKKSELFFQKTFFGVKKSKFANRLKRALPKFRGDRSEVRGVNGRSKFVAASAGFAKRKQCAGVLQDLPACQNLKNFFGVKKSKVANRPKRVLPKFRGDRSHVRRVRGRLGGIREA